MLCEARAGAAAGSGGAWRAGPGSAGALWASLAARVPATAPLPLTITFVTSCRKMSY